MSHINEELKMALDHVGLDGDMLELDDSRITLNQRLEHRFSFWTADAYVFEEPASSEEWLCVDEVLPMPAQTVLIWPSFHGAFSACFSKEGFWNNGKTYPATHWRPLPEGPSDLAVVTTGQPPS